MKLKILVASHKPDKVYKDDVYTPIHVGRAISQYKKEMSDMIGDDTGDNISEKNPAYCELTAMYWAWKNLQDVEYMGLAHYRRYFETKFTKENIDAIMKDCDVVLAKPYMLDTLMWNKLSRSLAQEDVVIFFLCLRKLFPKYEQTVLNYLFDFRDIAFNMCIMRKEHFNEYCNFLFSVLSECEKYMKPLPYTCLSRRLGYIAEYLLPIYCIHNNLRIRYENVVSYMGEKKSYNLDIKMSLKVAVLRLFHRTPKEFDELIDHSIKIGLKQDGIVIE